MTKATGGRRAKGIQKVLVRMWKPLAQRLLDLTVKACLRRDEYLDRVLLHEAQALEVEMAEPNSEDGKAALERAFGCVPTTPVNFTLSQETVKSMNEVCDRKRVPRNAFVNRVVLLLTMQDEAVRHCLYPWIRSEDWDRLALEASKEHPDELLIARCGSTLRSAAQLASCDPFWSYRYRIGMRQRTDPETPNLHCARIPRDYFRQFKRERPTSLYIDSAEGLNCYLPDEIVDGTEANLSATRLFEEFEQWLQREDPLVSPPENTKGEASA